MTPTQRLERADSVMRECQTALLDSYRSETEILRKEVACLRRENTALRAIITSFLGDDHPRHNVHIKDNTEPRKD